MKKRVAALCALMMILLAGAALAEPLVYTSYRQMGWGDRVQVGWVDDEGRLWLVTGHDAELRWPWKAEEQLAWLRQRTDAELIGTLSHEELFGLKSLVYSAEAQELQTVPAACDAGTERSFLVRDGGCVLLGMSGDDVCENTDPNAQALYRCLRLWFPQVTCYGGGMGPAGFRAVPLREFCGMDGREIARITAVVNDCEAGPSEAVLSAAEEREIRRLMAEGRVTGKANATLTTGGTVTCRFYDAGGEAIGQIELYHGLLVCNDGMYYLE